MATLASPVRMSDGTSPDPVTRLEIELYVSLAGLADRATELARDARGGGDRFTADRAELVHSDALSRAGELQMALALQREIAARAQRDGRTAVVARAGCYLASTCFRLGLGGETQDACGEAVGLLDDHCPPHWHVEHHMVLALFTGYDRAGAGCALFEESLRRGREYGDPALLLAVLNNFTWVAHQTEASRPRAAELVEEMSAMLAAGRGGASPSVIDTIAWIRLEQGDLDEAERLFELALAADADVEPDGRAAVLTHLATVRRRQGRPRDAVALLEQARASALALKTPEWAIESLRALAELDAERGDHRRAYRRMVRYVTEQGRFDRAESDRRAAALQTIHATQLERDQRRYYEELAVRDPLTGLYNRRHLERELPELLSRGAVALALVDIDHFKQINDDFSHDVGDSVLQGVGRMLRGAATGMSPGGFAVRLGGDELVVIAPGIDTATARAALGELRDRLTAARWDGGARPTISVGLVGGDGRRDTHSTLLARADDLLYRAKREGRDRVVSDLD